MTDSDRADRRKLSAESSITLGLALLIALGVWRASEKVSEIEAKLEQKFVSREVFEVHMASLKQAIYDLRIEVGALRRNAVGDHDRQSK